MSTPVPLASPNSEELVDRENSECVKETPKAPTHTHHLSPGKLRKSPHIGHQLDEATEERGVEDDWNNEADAFPFSASPRLNQIRTRFSEQQSPTIQSSHSPDFKKLETPQLIHTNAGRMNAQLEPEMSSKFTTNFPPENNHASFSKEILSPRFQAIMRLTSGRKRHGRDVKSFSHELNSKGVHPYPHWKPRAATRIEEIMAAIKAKFYRLKEEVNGDLSIFAGDLVGILEDSSVTHPEWRENLEDLLVIARHCALMSADDFWFKCESIVQNLDDRRQDLPVGTLKQAHSRILFILTRCTRLVQFHKEGGREDGHILGLYQLSDLGVYSEQISEAISRNFSIKQKENNTEKADESSHHQYQSPIVSEQAFLTETFFGNTDDEAGTASSTESASSYRMSSWRRFPSPCEKNKKFGTDDADFTSTISSNLLYIKDESETSTSNENTYGSGMQTPTPGSHDLASSQTRRVSWGPLINQKITISENMMICRICEVEIPILYVEEHSKICTIVDRCDLKGLTVNQRLERVSETLEKILESWMPKGETFDGGRSPRMTRMSKCDGSDEAKELLRRQNDLGGRLTEEILEYASVSDFMILPEGHSLLSDSGEDSSSSESLTPRSPLLTPRVNQIELLFSHPTIRENDDWQQVLKLLNIVHSISDSSKSVNTILEELKYVVRNRKVDALVIDTFGKCIEKLVQEKCAQLCGQIEEDPTIIMGDEDGSTEDETSHSLRASPVYTCSKDRTSIEDFEIIKPISRGAYGRVFLAKKRATGDLFAIKVLKKVDMIRKNAVDSILAERNILISVRNPFVVRFFYSFTCRENLYLVMEYLNGGDLYSLLKNLGCLDEDMARSYIAEIVLALEYLHSLNVIHRDLKPDNLLIGPDGHIKLTDFGLSKVGLINSTDELSSTGGASSTPQKHAVVGTPDYLAPEILLGMGHGPTADWWSVGVILFELLVGIPPFNAENPQQIFDNIMNRDIPWPRIPEEMSYDAYHLIDSLLGENGVQRLGATGAGEVKRHAFFRGIDWATVARQKAIFVPASDGVEDTSYFTSRCVWNADDDDDDVGDETTDTCSLSCSGSSFHDEDGDEFGNLTGFGSPPEVKHTFSNFSFKNLSQLASINYDLLTKTSKGSPPCTD